MRISTARNEIHGHGPVLAAFTGNFLQKSNWRRGELTKGFKKTRLIQVCDWNDCVRIRVAGPSG